MYSSETKYNTDAVLIADELVEQAIEKVEDNSGNNRLH